MRALFLTVGLFCASAIAATEPSSPAWNGKRPFSTYKELKIDENQFCYVYTSISKDGILSVRSKYSNGKKIDGDHFLTAISFYDKAGKPIYVAIHGLTGMNPANFGGATEKTVEGYRKLNADVLKRSSAMTITCKTKDQVPDKEIAKKIVEALAEKIGAKEEAGKLFDKIIK